MAKAKNNKGWAHRNKPASGIPAGGAGLHGPARGGVLHPPFTADNQGPAEAKVEGKAVRAEFRAKLEAKLAKVEKVYDRALKDADVRVGLVAAKQISVELWGSPAQSIGGDPDGVPMKTIVTWEDGT